MELKLLRAFVALASAGHYGLAASRLFVTQPTLSKQIQALEIQVGGALFERGRHGAKLTPLGGLLLKEAGRLISLSDEIAGKLNRAKTGLAGHLDLGFGLSTLLRAPAAIATFRRAVPDCEITLNDLPSDEQHRRLRDGRLDLGFCRAPTGDDLAFRPILDERLALVLPRGTPLPVPDRRADLNRLGFVALARQRGAGLAAQIDRWCAEVGFRPRVVQYADDILTVHAVVAAGLGAALLPMGVTALGDQTDRHPLDGEAAVWPVGICWRTDDANPLLRRLVVHIGAT